LKWFCFLMINIESDPELRVLEGHESSEKYLHLILIIKIIYSHQC
jgi:hypothetical protein